MLLSKSIQRWGPLPENLIAKNKHQIQLMHGTAPSSSPVLSASLHCPTSSDPSQSRSCVFRALAAAAQLEANVVRDQTAHFCASHSAASPGMSRFQVALQLIIGAKYKSPQTYFDAMHTNSAASTEPLPPGSICEVLAFSQIICKDSTFNVFMCYYDSTRKAFAVLAQRI